MQFVRVANKAEFENRRWKRVTLLGRKLAVFREPDDSYYAIEVACKHQNWDLTTGKIDGDIVVCPRHGWVYHLKTGECLSHDSTPLRRYEVRIVGEEIWVSLLPVEKAADKSPD